MGTHADKTPASNAQAIATGVSRHRNDVLPSHRPVNQRPEANEQRALRESIQESSHVKQLQAYRDAANNSPQVRRLKSYQAVAGRYRSLSTEQKQSVGTQSRKEHDKPQQQGSGLPRHTPLSSGMPVQRVLSGADAAWVEGGAGGAGRPTAEELASIVAFFSDRAEIQEVCRRFHLRNFAELAQACRTRFALADLQALMGADAGEDLTLDVITTLAALNGNPSMQHIIALHGADIGGVAVTFDNIAAAAGLTYDLNQLRQLARLPNFSTWAEVRSLSVAAVPFASIQAYAPLTVGGVACAPAQMIACHGYRFRPPELAQLCAVPQIAQWADLARLHATAMAVPDIVAYGNLLINGVRMSLDRLVACDNDRFSPADMQTVTGIAQVTTWPHFERLHAMVNWPADDLLALSRTRMADRLATLDEMCALAAFTRADVVRIVGKGDRFRDWGMLANLAKIQQAPDDGSPSEDTVTAMAALGMSEKKEDVAGVLDITRSCWNWATQGFEATTIPDDTLFSYFARRANFPSFYERRLTHTETVDFLARTPHLADPIRVYLNRNQAALSSIVDHWIQNRGLDGDVANRDAQLALMRLHLTESGFDVQPQGTNTRWYICMHERQANVGWEHWWIKTRSQDVIETFPATADGRGRSIAFHQSTVNMGNADIDFRHEVPVTSLLPAQLAIINRAMRRAKTYIAS